MGQSPTNNIPHRDDVTRTGQVVTRTIFRDASKPGSLFWVDENGNEYELVGPNKWQSVTASGTTSLDYSKGRFIRIGGADADTNISVPSNPSGAGEGLLKIQGDDSNPITHTEFAAWDLGGKTFSAPNDDEKALIVPFFYDSVGDVWHANVDDSYEAGWT